MTLAPRPSDAELLERARRAEASRIAGIAVDAMYDGKPDGHLRALHAVVADGVAQARAASGDAGAVLPIVPGPNAITSAITHSPESARALVRRLNPAGEPADRPVKRDDPEAREQRAFFAKIDALPDSSPYVALRQCYAVPNGGKRGMLTAKKMRAEGVRRGELDINLDLARGGFFGLRLEMKAEGGSLSVDQRARMEEHRRNGFAPEVAFGAEEAWRIATRYISLPPTLVLAQGPILCSALSPHEAP